MRKKRKIDFMYFDLGCVIVPVKKEAVVKGLTPYSELDFEDLDTIFKYGYTGKYRDFWDIVTAFDRGEFSTREFYRRISIELKLDIEFERFVEIWQRIMGLDSRFTILLRRLRENGVRTGIISDLCSINHDRFWEMVSREFFDITFFSYQERCTKSDEGGVIFDRAIRAANLPAERIGFIDDRAKNILAAYNKGLWTFWYRNEEMFKCFRKNLRNLGAL
ncbi:hypothetical protein ACFL29_02390 [Patescibacteria group bacterium]